MSSAYKSLFNLYNFKVNKGSGRFTFETSVIKNKMVKILSHLDYEKMTKQSQDDMYKFLNDKGYALGSEEEKNSIKKWELSHYEWLTKMLKAFEKSKGSSIEASLLSRYVKIPFDFFNLKLLYKALQSQSHFETLEFLPFGFLNKESLFKIYTGKEVAFQEKTLKKYLRKYRLKGEITNPVEIDLSWDLYLHEFYQEILPSLGSEFLKSIHGLQTDIKNILSFLRIRFKGEDFHTFKTLFLKGGSLHLNTFAPLYKEEIDTLASHFSHLYFAENLRKGLETYKETKSLADIEKSLEESKLSVLKKATSFLQGKELFLSYYQLKANELSNLKMLMACKTNHIDPQWVLSKIRIAS